MNSTTIKHYICKNNCENSGGNIAGNCPVCNTPYTHNEKFHAKDFLKNGPLNVPDETQTNTNNTPSPATNSSGVYHYVCNNGCMGGSGKAEPCKSCGETLIHNQAYHSN